MTRKVVMLLIVLAALSTNALAEEKTYETLIGDPLKYSGVATDKEGDMVKITVDWGDNSQSSSEFVTSGTTVNFSHTWNKPGKYILKSQATDNTGMVSKWKDIGQVIVSAPTEYLTIWLKDTDNNSINGIVELWNENFHVETAVYAENPFKYKLQPGNYNITAKSPGYDAIQLNFSVNRTLNSPTNVTFKLSKIKNLQEQKAAGGFSTILGLIAIAFLTIANRRR